MHHTELCNLTMAQEVKAARVNACEDIIGYIFNDKDNILEALRVTGRNDRVDEGNKRIALLGDRAMELILTEEWHASGERRGTSSCSLGLQDMPITIIAIFTRDSAAAVCSNAHLAKICQHHRLEELVVLPFMASNEARKVKINEASGLSEWMLATIVEAIIGAVYCDGGLPAARTVMTGLGLFARNSDVMATSSIRGASADLMVLSIGDNLKIWIPCRASE